jgi:DNA-binding transcriptional LysR family regulator
MAGPDARTLEIFRAIAATGSATRAASKLNTTQPNVTRAIGMFEKDCGFALFERGRYGMTLTPAGQQLLGVVERNWAGLKTVTKAIAELRSGPPGMLHAIAVPFLAEGAMAALLSAYLRDNPQIRLSLKIHAHDRVANQVEMGQSDIGMIIGPPPIGADLQLIPFGESRLALVVPQAHRFACREVIDCAELHGEQFVQLSWPNHIRIATDTMLANAGAQPSLVHEVATQRSLVELVRLGLGIGLADLAMIQSIGGVVAVPIMPAISWPIRLIHNGSRTHSAMLHAFLTWFSRRSVQEAAWSPQDNVTNSARPSAFGTIA